MTEDLIPFLALLARADGAETLVGPDAVCVTVRPIRLQCVIADLHDTRELKRRRNVARLRTHGHASEEIGLARAARARTGTAKLLDRIV